MTDTVTRLMKYADRYSLASSLGDVAGEERNRQALQDELTRLFTPLSDEQISAAFQFRPDRTPKAFARTIENLHGIGGES